MKLVNFLFKGEKNVGALLDDGVCSFKSISDKYSISMLEFVEPVSYTHLTLPTTPYV